MKKVQTMSRYLLHENTDMHVGHVHFAVVKEITKEDLEDHTRILRHSSREPTVLHSI